MRKPDIRAGAGLVDPVRLPAGEVSFLFSDIEQSTRAWERHPGAMAAALAQHMSIVRHAVSAADGVVVKDTGDGLFAVFASARAAVVAAVESQRGLRAATWGETGPLRARMGVHTADAEPERGDYHGVPVNRCARIMAVAHGGQVLVSEAVYRRVAFDPAPDVSFLDLGSHRLRDLSVPVQLLQVLHPDLDVEFPPLRALDAWPNNLPAVPSGLVGRGQELAEVADLLDRTRLLTMTGAGGVGKTRLALQLAADQTEKFVDGVWVVDLAGLLDPDLVAQAVASALGIAEQPGRSWLDSVLWYLRERRALMLMDNCEHLLSPVAALVEAVLERCPSVKVLATSREALRTPGEVAWAVPSLPLPDGVAVSDAERLFLERAREADPHFRPGDDDRAAVAKICLRLDGLPLAIELAASRIRVLSAAEIADRLDDRFRLLTGGARTALPRQRTLEAAVAWSFELLDSAERRLFARLSVFAGGFTLAAAEAVCAGDPIEERDVFDLLSGLTDRSLVVHEPFRTPSRYRLLETMRAYGRERLLETGELPAVRNAHLAWANDFARQASDGLEGGEQQRWLSAVADDLDNVRAALAWSLSGGDITIGLACASSLYRYWYVRAVREGKLWLDRLVDAAGEATSKILAKALYADGSLTQFTGDHDGACRRHERALAIYRDLHRRRGEAWALHGLGAAEWNNADPGPAKRRFEDALEIFREINDPVGVAFSLQFLILWETRFGDLARAARYLGEHGRLVAVIGMPLLQAHHEEFTALVIWRSSRDATATRHHLLRALELYRSIGSIFCTFHELQSVAYAMAQDGRGEIAARLLGAVDARRDESGTPVPEYEHPFYEESRALALEALGACEYDTARRSGASLSIEDATALAQEALESR